MPRFHVSVTMLATVTIDAVDAAAATREAVRFTELSGPEGGFIDGWNSAAEPGSPVIVDFSNVDIEEPDAEDVREVSRCRTDDCDGSPDNGEGYNGYCGTCADRKDAADD